MGSVNVILFAFIVQAYPTGLAADQGVDDLLGRALSLWAANGTDLDETVLGKAAALSPALPPTQIGSAAPMVQQVVRAPRVAPFPADFAPPQMKVFPMTIMGPPLVAPGSEVNVESLYYTKPAEDTKNPAKPLTKAQQAQADKLAKAKADKAAKDAAEKAAKAERAAAKAAKDKAAAEAAEKARAERKALEAKTKAEAAAKKAAAAPTTKPPATVKASKEVAKPTAKPVGVEQVKPKVKSFVSVAPAPAPAPKAVAKPAAKPAAKPTAAEAKKKEEAAAKKKKEEAEAKKKAAAKAAVAKKPASSGGGGGLGLVGVLGGGAAAGVFAGSNKLPSPTELEPSKLQALPQAGESWGRRRGSSPFPKEANPFWESEQAEKPPTMLVQTTNDINLSAVGLIGLLVGSLVTTVMLRSRTGARASAW